MYEIYTITSGDTMFDIANKFGTTEEILNQINGLYKSVVLSPGMQIVVPSNKNQAFWYYTVAKGDNLYGIANKYNIDYDTLLKLNGLDENDYIYPNQTIMLPREGINIYMTKENDTLSSVLDNIGIGIDEIMRDNEMIYLLPEQVIVFRNK